MPETNQSQGLLSQFVNWLKKLDEEIPSTNRAEGSQDFFSKLMNRISS